MLKCQSINFAGEQLFHKSYYTRMRRFLFSLIAGEQLLYKDAKVGHKVHSVKNRILRRSNSAESSRDVTYIV